MFDGKFNIIHGDRSSGRTQIILEISRYFKEHNIKLFFLSCTSVNDKKILSLFDDYRIIDSSEFNNLKILEVVKEICQNKDYSFLIVDDIDYLSRSCYELLMSIDINKIATCLTYNCSKLLLPVSSVFHNVFDVDLNKTNNLIKNILRDKKINSLLND